MSCEAPISPDDTIRGGDDMAVVSTTFTVIESESAGTFAQLRVRSRRSHITNSEIP
jgi:hypothetical protein